MDLRNARTRNNVITSALPALPKVIVCLIYSLMLVECSPKKESAAFLAPDTLTVDTITSRSIAPYEPEPQFEGEYMIGDATWIISPVADSTGIFEMRSSPTVEPSYILHFSEVEADTVRIYSNLQTTSERQITIKMYPGHDRGMYYEDDEHWSVQRIRMIP